MSIVILPAYYINPLQDSEFFVSQQYRDFLKRTPDDAGFAFWVGMLRSCEGDVECLKRQRLGIVCAFITSVEYQQRFGNVAFVNSDCGR